MMDEYEIDLYRFAASAPRSVTAPSVSEWAWICVGAVAAIGYGGWGVAVLVSGHLGKSALEGRVGYLLGGLLILTGLFMFGLTSAKALTMARRRLTEYVTLRYFNELLSNEAFRAEESARAKAAADASHAKHRSNKQAARDWYAAHSTMTKDAAAEKMVKDGIVHASFRTIRGYLTGQ